MKTACVLVIATVILLLSGCSSTTGANDPLTPSQLNANPSFYDEKVVEVRGMVVLKTEAHVIFESKELHDEVARRLNDPRDKKFSLRDYTKFCLTIGNPDFLYDHSTFFADKTLVLKGKFTRNYLSGEDIDLGACALPTGIIVDIDDLKHRYARYLNE